MLSYTSSISIGDVEAVGEYPDDGTLQKIKTLINPSNIPTDPQNNACEDFVQVS